MQQAQITDYKEAYYSMQAAYQALEGKYEAVMHELAQLKKVVFGSKSERFEAENPAAPLIQGTLGLDAETIATCKITEATKIEYIRTKAEVVTKKKEHPGA